jgi:hypothetical protein
MQPDEDQQVRRPELTLTAAAEACGVARITIRRRLDAGTFPNARQLEGPRGQGGGTWVIPIDDLLGAGLHPHKIQHPEPDAPAMGERAQDPDENLRAEVETQRVDLARARAERDLYQALAIERQNALTDLRTALRMLEAPRPTIIEAPKPRRRWGRRARNERVELSSNTHQNTRGV